MSDEDLIKACEEYAESHSFYALALILSLIKEGAIEKSTQCEGDIDKEKLSQLAAVRLH